MSKQYVKKNNLKVSILQNLYDWRQQEVLFMDLLIL